MFNSLRGGLGDGCLFTWVAWYVVANWGERIRHEPFWVLTISILLYHIWTYQTRGLMKEKLEARQKGYPIFFLHSYVYLLLHYMIYVSLQNSYSAPLEIKKIQGFPKKLLIGLLVLWKFYSKKDWHNYAHLYTNLSVAFDQIRS